MSCPCLSRSGGASVVRFLLPLDQSPIGFQNKSIHDPGHRRPSFVGILTCLLLNQWIILLVRPSFLGSASGSTCLQIDSLENYLVDWNDLTRFRKITYSLVLGPGPWNPASMLPTRYRGSGVRRYSFDILNRA